MDIKRMGNVIMSILQKSIEKDLVIHIIVTIPNGRVFYAFP